MRKNHVIGMVMSADSGMVFLLGWYQNLCGVFSFAHMLNVFLIPLCAMSCVSGGRFCHWLLLLMRTVLWLIVAGMLLRSACGFVCCFLWAFCSCLYW